MDNIQKLILGVLSIAGVLAMLVPSADTGMSGMSPAPVAQEAPPPAQTEEQTPMPETEQISESKISDDDIFSVGATIDGKPMDESFGNPSITSPPINYDLAPSTSENGQSGGSGITTLQNPT